MWIALSTILIVYVLWCALLYRVQGTLLYPRQMCPPAPQQLRYAEAIVLKRTIAEGHVPAYFLPGPRQDGRPAPLVIFCHGNADIIDFSDEVVTLYQRLGVSVLLPEYRGYGHAAGTPGQQEIREDLVWFYDQMLQRPEVDKQRIFFHGRSLGGGVACDLATVRKPAALVLESTFRSVAVMAWQYAAPPVLVKHPYRNDRVLPTLDVPMLLMHGSNDDIIPVAHGRTLRSLKPQARYCEFDCQHNDFPGSYVREYRAEVQAFLSESGLSGVTVAARQTPENPPQ